MASRNSNVGKTFNFKGIGNGIVIREARVDYENWSSVFQILQFTDENNKGELDLRFGYCDQTGKLIARPLYLTESQLTDLGRAAAREPEIRKMLKAFCDEIR
jgi:hypothetical protein